MKYDNTNTGALFKAKEQKTDKHPGYTGSINVEGKEYWLSGWVKEAKSGEKFFSLSVKAKDEKPVEKPKSGKFEEGPIPF